MCAQLLMLLISVIELRKHSLQVNKGDCEFNFTTSCLELNKQTFLAKQLANLSFRTPGSGIVRA